MESKLTLFKKWKILFFFFTMLCCYEVDASHFRGGTISWDCLSGNQVEYTITTQWAGTLYPVGSQGYAYSMYYGDGTSETLYGTVTFINTTENWFSQTLVITKTYSSPGQYTAEVNSCCRIGALPNGWGSSSFVLRSVVNAGAGCNEAPSLASPAFINVSPGNNQTCFQLNAVDPEGDPVTFSIANSAESGLFPDPSTEWPVGTLSASGLICVNPTTMPGAPSGGYVNGQLIPIPIKVSDNNGNGTIPGDIMLKVSTVTGVPPTWDYTITPADGSTINFFAGVAGNINVEAEDVDAGNTIDINPSGVPGGAIFTPALPNTSSPNATTLNWTPTAADAGSHPITLIAQDNAGLQTSTSFTIVVLTCSAPVATCTNATVGVDNLGLLTLDPSAVDNGSTADCGLQSLTVSPNTFDCTDVGSTVTVTLTITDVNGDSDACTADITIADLIPPTPLCDLSVTTTLSGATGEVDVYAAQMDDASLDNCTVYNDLVFSYSGTDMNDNLRTYDCSHVGFNNVSIWVWDEAGNVSEECFAILQVTDNTAPTCETKDITISLSHDGDASIVVADIDDGTTDWCGLDTMYLSIMDFDCDDVGVNVVTLTAEDNNGNISTCDANVTVEDNGHLHIHCQDITVQLDALGAATIDAEDLDDVTQPAEDNCGVASFAASKTSFTCTDIGTQVVVMTVTDVNGNTATCNSNVTVEDNVPPTPVCEDITVQLDAAGNVSITADMLDGGSTDACGIDAAAYSATQTSFTCSDLGDVTVTLTVTDNYGNTATCDATVTVEDNVDPVAVCKDITVSLDASGMASISDDAINDGSSDACGIVSYSTDVTDFDCQYAVPPISMMTTGPTVTRTFAGREVTFSNMNINGTGTNLVSVVAGTSITLTTDWNSVQVSTYCPGCFQQYYIGTKDLAIDCMYSGNTNSNLSGTGTVSFTAPVMPGVYPIQASSSLQFSCTATAAGMSAGITGAIGYVIVTQEVNMTVTDGSGNTSSCSATVTVEDITPPTAVCQDITISLDALGGAMIVGSDIDGGSTDACGIGMLATSMGTFDCTNVGANAVTLTVYDNNGNSSDCVAQVTVEDNENPVALCQDITIQLDSDGEASIGGLDLDNGSSDACGIDTMYVDIPDFTCAEVGVNTVTLTVVDNNGNMATCPSSVTVEDNVDPDCAAMDITVVLDQLGNYTVAAQDIDDGSSDACGIALYEIRREFFGSVYGAWGSNVNMDCSDVAGVNVQLRVTDNNGNLSICDAVVSVDDNTSPFMNCQDNIVVSLNSDGEGALLGINLLAWWGIFDACGIDNITVDGQPIALYDCSDIGFFDVLVRSEDINGNATECTVEIEVRDQEAPECETMDINVYLDAAGVASIDSNAVDNGSSDNCTITSITLDNQDFTCAMEGANTVTMTVTDQSGNSCTETAIVTVIDTIKPMCITQDMTAQLDASGIVMIDSNYVDNLSTDACGIASITVSPNSFTCAEVGGNTVIQTVTDINGNVSTCTAIVTVEDNVAPTAICMDAIVMLDAGGNGILTVADIDNGSNDACGILSLSIDMTAFTCANVGPNTVTLTVTDNNGNVSTCTANAEVVDNVIPVAMCQDVTIQLDAAGSAMLVPSDVDNGSFDVCGIAELCIGKGVETSSIAGELSSSDPTFTWEEDPSGPQACFFDPSIFNGCCDLFGPLHNYDQTQFTISGADTYTFTLTDVNGDMDFMGVIYDSEFNPLAICDNIIYGDDDSSGGLSPIITITLTMAPGDYILVTSTYNSPDLTNSAPYIWDITSLAGESVSVFECAPALEYGCSEIGDNTVTLCVTDVNGNVSYCSSTVTVEDNVAPTALCQDITVQLDIDGVAAIDSNGVDNTSTDACGIMSINTDIRNFSCADVGTPVTVTQTVMDINGNSSTCSAIVTVEDNVAPTALCQDITVQLDSDGIAAIDSNGVDNVSTDACGIASIETDIRNFSCADVGTPVTVVQTVTDIHGNSSTCSATVTVEDNVDPTALCQDITVDLDFNGNVTITGAMIDGGSTDACGIASLDAGTGTTDLDCSNVGANTVTLTVTDNNGNTATCDATVTVEDNTAPLVNCVNNVEVPLNTDGIGFVTKGEVTGATFDACGIVDTFIIRNDVASHPDYGVENEMLFFDCDDIGLVAVIIRVYDANGNMEECNTAVNVKDEILPTMECTSTTIYLDATGVAALDSNGLDNGSYDNCAIVEFSVSQTDFDCSHLGMNLITMTAEDQSGNTNTCSNGVMVMDTIKPTATCMNITVQLDATGNASITGAMVDGGSADNCNIVSMTASPNSFTCGEVGTNIVTLTVEDQSGNISTCTAEVTVEDNVAPVVECVASTINLELSDTNGTNATITPGQLLNQSVVIKGSNSGGASATTNYSVVITTPTVLDFFWFYSSNNSSPSYDNFGYTINGVYTQLTNDAGALQQSGTASVTLNPTDVFSLQVIATDNIFGRATGSIAGFDLIGDLDPANWALTNSTGGDGSAYTNNTGSGATDACGIASITIDNPDFDCSEIGDHTVILTATDVNGNSSTCSATVTVQDVDAPIATCMNITVQLDALGVASVDSNAVDNGSFDGCTVTSIVTDVTSFTCANLGDNTVTMTVTDQSGNTATCSSVVTVEDNVAPAALCQDITVQLDALGEVSITADMLDGGSTDACGPLTYTADVTSFDCSNVGANTVTVTVKDGSGNESTCTSTVTVEDNVDPVALCAAYTVQLDAAGTASISAIDVDGGSTDACGIASMSVLPSSFTCAEAGDNTVTLTVTDNNGNTSTCDAIVTVEDNVAPDAICMNISIDLDANGEASIDSNAVDGGSTDACGIASFITDITSFDCSNIGDNNVIMTVTDMHGNASTCAAIVTVVDVTGPVITCPADIIENTLPTDCNQNVIMPSLAPMDVCTGLATYEYSAVDITFIDTGVDTFALFPVGDTEVTVIATDGFGNTSECTFNVTVIDNIDPIIVGCASIGDITVDSDVTQCGANVTWDDDLINANDNCSGQGAGVIVTSDYNPGDLFSIGTTTVTYTATDDSGNTGVCTFDVTVNPSLPVADYTALSTSLAVIFTNASMNGATYTWDYDDGNTSTDENPSHAYATAGTYNVCLTAENACGDTDTYCEDVTVADTGECLDVVALNAGWNLISFDVAPTDNTLASVFADEISANNLILVTAFNGVSGATVFDPLLPPFLNSLQTIEPGYGYWIMVNNSSSVSLVGTCLDVDYKVDLTTGWNLVSFIPQPPTPPQVFFSDLISNGWLELVTGYDGGSKIYDPSFPIPALNTLTDLENGLGYWVKVNTDVASTDWLKGASNNSSTRDDENTDEWGNLRTNSYDFLSGTVHGVDDGQKIKVVNESGDLIVELEVFENGYLKMTPIYGDDNDTPDVIDGLIYEESLYFEYNDVRSEISIDFEGSQNIHFVDLDFEEVSTGVTTLSVDLSASIAPNPMLNSSTLTIEVSQSGNYTIQLIDMTGKQVRSVHSGLINAGKFETTIDRNDLVGGQYIIAIIGDNKDSYTRIPLLIIN